MDGVTLLIVILILGSVISLLWIINAVVFKMAKSTSIYYAIANGSFAISMLLYYLRGNNQDMLTYFGSDLALIYGCLMVKKGIEEFTGLAKRNKEQLILLIGVLGIDIYSRYFAYNHISVILVCLFSGYILLSAARHALEYLKKEIEIETKNALIILTPLYLVATFLLIRVTVTILIPEQSTDLRSINNFNTLFLLVMLISILGFNLTALGLIVSRVLMQIKKLSIEDGLTKIYNRRHITNIAENLIEKMKIDKKILSIIVLDIDRFKLINDTYGHAGGDQVLIACVNIIKGSIRKTDHIGRIGGEEFCIILPDTDKGIAEKLAERIRKNIEDAVIEWKEHKIKITVSLGVSATDSNKEDEQWSILLNKADLAMYVAKKNGRNKVIVNV